MHHEDLDRIEAEFVAEVGHPPGLLRRAVLKPVVDGHESGRVPCPRSLEGERGCECNGVRSTGTGDDDRLSGPRVALKGVPNREPDGGDCRGGSHALILADPLPGR
jgi:hypothetical protein